MTTIAIIGAGFSGTLLALHLLRRTPEPVRVTLIERHRNFGRGAAYGTGNPSHLLNVPAGKMSAFHDRPTDFFDWLKDQPEAPPDLHPGSFVSRRLFGAYVRYLLKEELRGPRGGHRLDLVRGDVQHMSQGEHRPLELRFERGRPRVADMAVLAIGNFPPEPPLVANPDFYDTDFYRADPWAPDALGKLDPAAPVMLIGTGLTMVDTVISLLDQGHTGPIHALSRRGLVPRQHQAGPAALRPAPDLPAGLVDCLGIIRQEIERARGLGGTWQSVIDDLRPMTRDLWQALAPVDQARFLRHLRPWWDVHRHRLAPDVAARIEALRGSGGLTIHAGRIDRYEPGAATATILWRPRGRDERRRLDVARVINCAGPGADYDRIADPLVRCLLDAGRVRPDPLRLGLDVTLSGALRDASGAISRRLFAIGPVTKGAFWEMTAVPDIRRQCELTAAHLATLV